MDYILGTLSIECTQQAFTAYEDWFKKNAQ